MYSINQAMQWAQMQGLARLEAQLLLLHALGRNTTERAWLLANATDTLLPNTRAVFERNVARCAAGEPLAYITGQQAFYGLDLHVDARVLVPRADTETLVDWALALPLDAQAAPRVLDLGTGSGAIALALKAARPQWQVMAVDASAAALTVAQANAQRLHLDIQWLQTDWLQGVPGPLALIVSNPPYIAAHDPHLPALRHEPLAALVSGNDGLDALRHIIATAPQYLQPGGWLLLEHGYDQADAVRGLLAAAGWHAVQSRRDLAGIERCSGGYKLG